MVRMRMRVRVRGRGRMRVVVRVRVTVDPSLPMGQRGLRYTVGKMGKRLYSLSLGRQRRGGRRCEREWARRR